MFYTCFVCRTINLFWASSKNSKTTGMKLTLTWFTNRKFLSVFFRTRRGQKKTNFPALNGLFQNKTSLPIKWTEYSKMKAVLVVLCVAFSAFSEAYCPFLCQCDDTKRKVVCSPKANLDIIPITLNPAIKEIHLRGNQIRYVTGIFWFSSTLHCW